jgi:uncharacterized membrane protein YeiH
MIVLEVLVWVGTITFAASGALVAVGRRFDVVGALVLAAVAAVGGGSIRDIVGGTTPPAIFGNEALLWATTVTGLVVFFLHERIPTGRGLYVLDTIGLGLFAALGAAKGLEVGFGFWGTIFAGAVSGVGGGVLRDLLSGQVPGILYRAGDFYASAAAAGAAVTWALFGSNPDVALVAGAVATAAIRVGSRVARLQLPIARDLT